MDMHATELHTQLLELALEPVLVWQLGGTITLWNRGASELYGYSREHAIGAVSHDLLCTVFSGTRQDHERRLAREGYWFGELVHTTRDGRRITVESRQQLVAQPDGRPLVLETNRDIGAHKETEVALKQSEERFRLALNQSPVLVFHQDRKLRYTWIYNANPGFRSETMIGKTDAALLSVEDAARLTAVKRRVLESGVATREELHTRIRGTDYYYELYVEPERDPHGAITGLFGVAVDIAARKQVELALRDSEARLRMALDGAAMGTWDWDLASDRLVWDDRQFALFGIDEGAFAGMAAQALERIHPEDQQPVRLAIQRAIERNEQFREEFRVVHDDGGVRWLAGRAQPIADLQGRTTRLIGVNFDITAHKENELEREHRHEEQLARLYRIGTVNELASGLAHELSQPLTAIQNYAGGALKWLNTGGDMGNIRTALEAIDAQSQRVVDIIQHLRRLMAAGAPQRVPTDLGVVIDRAYELLSIPLAHKNVRVDRALAPDLPPVAVDPLQIEQVLIILLRNCLDVFTGEYLAHPVIEVRVAARNATAVEVAVSDNGPGAAPAVVERMFEPFYTTKEKGLGLGLMLARSIVRAHGGTIRARPRSSGGLTVRFTLPLNGGPRK
jgi:PAS domain S-box-containing protein